MLVVCYLFKVSVKKRGFLFVIGYPSLSDFQNSRLCMAGCALGGGSYRVIHNYPIRE